MTQDWKIKELAERWMVSLVQLRFAAKHLPEDEDVLYSCYRDCVWHLMNWLDVYFLKKEKNDN